MTTLASGLAPGVDLARAQRPRRSRRRPTQEPVYALLAEEWQQSGRLVPGERDQEWVELTTRDIWHR